MKLTTANRGASPVVGFILIFGILVVSLGIYQTAVVPQQNEKVELGHSEQIQTDFNDLYSAAMNAAEDSSARTTTVKLGTKYPARSLTLNPPYTSGNLQTKSLDPIEGSVTDEVAAGDPSYDIEQDICGLPADTATQSLNYRPNYNYLRGIGVHGYQHSAVYHDANGAVPTSEQSLVKGDTIRLRPLVGQPFTESGTASEPVTIYPGATGGTTIETGSDWSLTLGSDLTVSQWQTILADQSRVESISSPSPGQIRITFTDGRYRIRCTPLGLGETPNNQPTVTESEDDSGATINPVGPEALELDSTSASGGTLQATFFNNDDDASKTVVAVRVPYVIQPGGGDNINLEITNPPNTAPITVQVASGFTPIPPARQVDWTWGSENDRTLEIGGSAISSPNNSGVAIEFEFADGTTSVYFVSTD